MTRTLSGARARQMRRRAHRASLRNVVGAPPMPVADDSDRAVRVMLGHARNALGHTRTVATRLEQRIGQLERRLDRTAP